MIVFKSFVIPEGVTACRIALQTARACLYATHGPTMSGYKLHNWGFVMIVGCLVVSTEDSGLGTDKSQFQARDHRASLKRAGTVDACLLVAEANHFRGLKGSGLRIWECIESISLTVWFTGQVFRGQYARQASETVASRGSRTDLTVLFQVSSCHAASRVTFRSSSEGYAQIWNTVWSPPICVNQAPMGSTYFVRASSPRRQ